VISSSMGGIPPARFANHDPFSYMFSDATISGKRCRHGKAVKGSGLAS